MLWRVGQLVYLMLPAYAANMTPPFARFWRGWNHPISERWLGSHKTVVGAIAGVATGVLCAFLESRIHWRGALVSYERWPIIGIGLGAGAMGGDIAKSFVKRRIGIAAGERWIPADQLDFAVGALVVIARPARLGLTDVAIVLVVTWIGDVVVNRVAYMLGIRERPW